MKDNSVDLFLKEIKALLEKTLVSDESVVEDENYDFFTSSGIAKLEIPANSYIEIKYFTKDNLRVFRRMFFSKKNNISLLGNIESIGLFVICNLSSIRIKDLLKKLHIDNNLNVISIDDLRNAVLSSNSLESSLPYWLKITPNKSVQYELFDDFLFTLIRQEMIMATLQDCNVNMHSIIAQKDSLLPFVYRDQGGQSHVFISKGSRYSKRSVLFDEKAVVHKVDFNFADEKITTPSIDGNEYSFKRIPIKSFGKSVPLFNSCARIVVLRNQPQYKYRKFGNSSLSKFNIGNKDYKYTRKVIEENEIYFSTKYQLNDPFDLDADYVGKPFDITSDNYRVFCTTDDYDNILMWSHYGDSHYGYCTSYYPLDVIYGIENEEKIEFCVYGYVSYNSKRKTDSTYFKLIFSCFDDEAILLVLQINQLFKKFSDWAYEKEFRYIVCLNKNRVEDGTIKEGVSIRVAPVNYYFGQKFEFNDKTKSYLKKFIGNKCFTFDLSKTDYKLETKEEKL